MQAKKDQGIPAIVIATVYLLTYTILLNIQETYRFASLMLMFSPFLIIWMVLRVLRHGTASKRTFDKYFYDDVDF